MIDRVGVCVEIVLRGFGWLSVILVLSDFGICFVLGIGVCVGCGFGGNVHVYLLV